MRPNSSELPIAGNEPRWEWPWVPSEVRVSEDRRRHLVNFAVLNLIKGLRRSFACGILLPSLIGGGSFVGQAYCQTVGQNFVQEDGSAQDEKTDQASLQQQWKDYLISPVTDQQRDKVLDQMTQEEKDQLDAVLKKTDAQLDAVAAQVYLTRLCEMGPRISGSQAMLVQQKGLESFFEQLGAKVNWQTFTVPHPETRVATDLNNMVVSLHPDRRRRILICCHYDTRPYADQDKTDPRARLLGANDGASGVGLLMVLAPALMELEGRTGIDLVFFDAEEWVYDRQRDSLFLGSTHFARQYAQSPPKFVYVGGVLIDMIGDRNLELYYEKNSLEKAAAITKSVWNKARQLEVQEFVPKQLHEVRDDHLPLNQIARIPTTDLIDFDYPNRESDTNYWHTREDTPDKCSPASLGKVGVVLYEWAKGYIR